MGEIDTKPIDSVQAGIYLFGAIGDQNKHKLTLTGSNVRFSRVYSLTHGFYSFFLLVMIVGLFAQGCIEGGNRNNICLHQSIELYLLIFYMVYLY